jgi:hypothetical protein
LRPYLEKNPSQKRTGGMAQGVGPEFKPQYYQNKTKNQTNKKIIQAVDVTDLSMVWIML